MTADILPVLSFVRKRILPDIELFRFRVSAKSDKATIPFFIDYHFCNGLVAVPRMCPCATIAEELCYRTPLSRDGTHVAIFSLLATAMALYERTFEPFGETALIVSGNYNIGESDENRERQNCTCGVSNTVNTVSCTHAFAWTGTVFCFFETRAVFCGPTFQSSSRTTATASKNWKRHSAWMHHFIEHHLEESESKESGGAPVFCRALYLRPYMRGSSDRRLRRPCNAIRDGVSTLPRRGKAEARFFA